MLLLKRNYCHYEPVRATIDRARVIVVDSLIYSTNDLSDVAAQEPDFNAEEWVKEERTIAGFAIGNIVQNVKKLVETPEVQVVSLAKISPQIIKDFDPDAIILSGTLRDFDMYQSSILQNVSSVLATTTVPVLGICGGHQLVGQAFGLPIVTLDHQLPHQRRHNRLREYEYRFVKVIEPEDPIFRNVLTDHDEQRRSRGNTIWVWQNHGLMVDGMPDGFELLAKGYVCQNQMMVKRGDGQLIYTVQFHIEKSFEDWRKTPSRWEHPNESRDGRKLFENFLVEALKHRGQVFRQAQSA
ncbi:MAG: gamma-glutamyl-gamma-aminobutyrate hydrolase family protein [Acidobacteria bacterium]|nr:gamma-glutamyl-gamma-aminobutyrate hydrolase family protein [Acidobacteriota bacterium]